MCSSFRKAPYIKLTVSFLYNLVFLFKAEPGFFLCNVEEICAVLASHMQRLVIIKKLTGPKYKSLKSDLVQTTVHWVSCAISSGVFWVTLHRIFSCAMLSQEYYQNIQRIFFMCSVVWSLFDNNSQGLYLCNAVSRVLGQHWAGSFMCKVVWSLLDDIAQGFYLCNVESKLTDNFYEENNLYDVVSTMLGQRCIGILFFQCCPNTFETTMHKKSTCAVLPVQCCVYLAGTTLHKNIPYSMLSKYVCDNIAQEDHLHNISCERTDMFFQETHICNVSLVCLGQHCTKQLHAPCKQYWCGQTWPTVHSLINVIQIQLRRHFTIQLLVQCWPRPQSHLFAGKISIYNVVLICLSQHCTKKLPVQCWRSLQTTLHRKIIYNFFWIYLDQHCIRKLLAECSPMAKRQCSWENNLYNVVSTILEQHCIGILFSQCFPNSNVDPECTNILSKENRLFHIRLVDCFFKSGTISPNNIGSFWSMLTPEFIYSLQHNNGQGLTLTGTSAKCQQKRNA